MCGICGYIGRSFDQEEVITQMLRTQRHRGPDNTGVWCDNHIWLGHNRLSILDVSSKGNQPMKRNDLVIVFNGEIYNYIELKRELTEKFDVDFCTGTDTEVILASWEIWKEKCLEKFRGMWAFAMYNQKTQELFLCRDRFGIKPLYYYFNKNINVFSSEIKSILENKTIPRRLHLPTVADFLVGFHDHNEFTFFEGIMQIPPGHFLYFNLRENYKKLIKYYDLAKRVEYKTSTVEEFAQVFQESVWLHLRSDVPIGTCLSGGLDSSSIASAAACYMKKDFNRPFYAVTAQSADPANDETLYARQVAEHSELKWHLTKPRVEDVINDWEQCLWFQDEPTLGLSIFLQYCVMKTANEIGLKVMLDGQGGDEALLGYERYYPTMFWQLLKTGKISAGFMEFINAIKNSKLNTLQMAMYLTYFLSPSIRVARNAKKYRKVPKLIIEHGLNTIRATSELYHDIKTLQIAEITKYQMPKLLKYEDRNSMAWSIEARVPFVDHRLIETAIALKPMDKIRNGYTKWALRKIMHGKMPDDITWRKNKIGFEVSSKWELLLNADINNRISKSIIVKELNLQDLISNENKLLLYNLACWERVFNVNLP